MDLFSGLAPLQCLLWLSSIYLLFCASFPSILLTMPSSGCQPQDTLVLQVPSPPPPHLSVVSGKAGDEGHRLGLSWGWSFWASTPSSPHIHTCLRPQPPPQGPHLARVLSFLGCKLPPAAPWHLLRFRFHEPFSLGGFREGWRFSVFPSFVCLRPQREILGNVVSDSSVQVLGELWFLAGG